MANRKQILTASNIKYSLALYALNPDSTGIRCIRLAKALGVSKPSVHKMISTLKDMKLVRKDLYGTVSFTDTGHELARQYSGYYETLYIYLKKYYHKTLMFDLLLVLYGRGGAETSE